MNVWKRARVWRRRRQFETDLEEEMRIHREMSGGPAFGSMALALEQSREAWGLAWLDSWTHDIRYALRGMVRKPAFALTVIGTIAIGLGLNTTMFTVFNAYALRPFAVRDPYALYGFTWYGKKGNGHNFFSWDRYNDLRALRTPFADALAWDGLAAEVDGRTMFGMLVSGNYFTMLGAGTIEGRPLLPEDAAAPGAGAVMVLGYDAWRNKFAGDPGIVGRKVYMRGQPFEVVGIANPAFAGLEIAPVGFWIPVSMYGAVANRPDVFGPAHPEALHVIGRLQPGITIPAAKDALLAWSRANWPEAVGVVLQSRATSVPITRDAIMTFIPLFTAFGLVLVIACANVANMMLARALARQREVAIRVSLGAGRARLVRQLLTESVLLAVPAAVVGFAISEATIGLAQRLLFATVPPAFGRILAVNDLAPDWRVFWFILAASIATALLFGLAPAIQTTRSRLVEANRGDFSSDYRPARLRSILVAAQVAVCALLLISTGIVLRSERRAVLAGGATGLDLHQVWDLEMMSRHQARASAQLAESPEVEAVAAAWFAPLYGSLRTIGVVPSGKQDPVRIGYNFVSSGYYPVFRIPVVHGRAFTAAESDAEAPVMMVSESAARRLWPNRDALGERISFPRTEPGDPYFTRAPQFASAVVIGVVRDTRSSFIGNYGAEPCLYLPTNARAPHNTSVLVRMRGGIEDPRRHLLAVLDRVAPSLSDFINPMEDVLALQVYPFRVTFWVAGFLGGIALLLTISGIYGVISYLVSERTKEIGIRLALGAGSWAVLRMVLRQSARLVAIGSAIGIGLALMVAPVFAHQIEVIQPYDAVAYGSAAAVILIAGVAAAWHPARRAVAIDPVRTLRCD